MAAYTTIYGAATDAAGNLVKQVAVAINQAATNVLNEDPGSVPNHGQRLEWAQRIKNVEGGLGPVDAAKRWIWSVLENTTIAADPVSALDTDVQFVVNGLVDTMARAG